MLLNPVSMKTGEDQLLPIQRDPNTTNSLQNKHSQAARTRAYFGGDSGAVNTAASAPRLCPLEGAPTGPSPLPPIQRPARPELPARAASPFGDCALDCPASRPKAGHRHEAVELRKGPPPPHRRLERAKSYVFRSSFRNPFTGMHTTTPFTTSFGGRSRDYRRPC